MKLIDRSEWNAKAPRKVTRITSTRGVKVHYTGGPVPSGIVDDHDLCIKHVRDVQHMHMSGGREVPYADIAYNMVACPHREVFMGRGPHVLPAANGPGMNSGHYAVLALVGTKGFVVPTDELLLGVLDAIDYLRKHGDAGSEIKGHRDGYATTCPGDALYAWIKQGASRPGEQPASWTEELVDSLPTLRLGDDSFDVKTVRWLLGARGRIPSDVYSTVYDETLAGEVAAFQSREHLDPDGVCGKATWGALLRRK